MRSTRSRCDPQSAPTPTAPTAHAAHRLAPPASTFQVPTEARELIRALLQPSARERLGGHWLGGMQSVAAHAFFEGMVGEELYQQQPPHLAGGAAAPQPNASWARRQNSIMWSPLPQRYSFGDDDASGGDALAVIEERAEEAAAGFTRSLMAARERSMPPPPPFTGAGADASAGAGAVAEERSSAARGGGAGGARHASPLVAVPMEF